MDDGGAVSRLVPVLVFAPLACVAVDRWDRRRILIATDLIRVVATMGFLTITAGAPIWVAVVCSGVTASATTFFEAAKNASIANVVTRQEMLTVNVLMFSTRFLQLSLGAALGGVTAAKFGHNTAFVINALSFVVSAAFIWVIPTEAMHVEASATSDEEASQPAEIATPRGRRFWIDVREGLAYIWQTQFIKGVVLVNVGWALGGGMNNLIYDRMARQEFTYGPNDPGDWSLAALVTAAGAGLFIGMALARRVGAWVTDERRTGNFVGWLLLIHGLWFVAAGLMP